MLDQKVSLSLSRRVACLFPSRLLDLASTIDTLSHFSQDSRVYHDPDNNFAIVWSFPHLRRIRGSVRIAWKLLQGGAGVYVGA